MRPRIVLFCFLMLSFVLVAGTTPKMAAQYPQQGHRKSLPSRPANSSIRKKARRKPIRSFWCAERRLKPSARTCKFLRTRKSSTSRNPPFCRACSTRTRICA